MPTVRSPGLGLLRKGAGHNVRQLHKGLALVLPGQAPLNGEGSRAAGDLTCQLRLAGLIQVEGGKGLLLRRRKGTARHQGVASVAHAIQNGRRRWNASPAFGLTRKPTGGVVQRAAVRIRLVQLLMQAECLVRQRWGVKGSY